MYLPKWVTVLGNLVTEDKISSGEMIVAVEYLLEY